jgi:hypothetical protein
MMLRFGITILNKEHLGTGSSVQLLFQPNLLGYVLVDFTALHHEHNFFHDGDVG